MAFLNQLHRGIALTLSVLMFLTSVGVSIDMHFCQDQLKSFNFFGKAKSCHDLAEAVPMKNCAHHKKMMVKESGCYIDAKDCCSSKTLHIQSDQDQQVQTSNIHLDRQLHQFLVAYMAVFFTNDFSIESETISFTHYKPPLISRDISVLNQTFLL